VRRRAPRASTRRTAEDPQWPLIAAQLLGRDPVRTDPGLLIEAGVLTGRLLRDALDAPGRSGQHTSMSVGLSLAHVRRTWHAHRPHARACADLLKEAGALTRARSRPFRPAHREGTRSPRDADVRESSFLVDLVETVA
jgi:hypothetical protein